MNTFNKCALTVPALFVALMLWVPAVSAQGGVKITPLTINSAADDFASAFSGKREVMYFTSERPNDDLDEDIKQKIFMSVGWSTPEVLSEEINAGIQNGAVSITPDGQYMIFSAYEHEESGEGRTDLYSARKINGKWTDIRNLGPNVNSSAWDAQPSISADGSILFFASDRPGGEGGADIYMCRREANGWTKAKNLGASLNSQYDEMSPVIGPDNKTFYFASNRPDGRGGFDIWHSTQGSASFSLPKNAGESINSNRDEYFFTPLLNSDIAYFSSNRPGGSGELDIYSAVPNPVRPEPVRVVQGVVRDAETGQPIGAAIEISDMSTGAKVGELRSDDLTGEYLVVLPAGRDYALTANKPDYLFYSEKFSVAGNEDGKEITYDINLSRNRTRLLVFFDFDKSTLQPDSHTDLDRVARFLKDNAGVRIELEGHTDDVGGDDYNNKLSERRAEAVKTYLLGKGIDSERVNTVGYGKRKPLVEGDSEAARAKNRRVDMKILR